MDQVDVQVLASPLSIDACYDYVLDPSCGGICLFVGTVRDQNKGETVTHLEFESYIPMAVKEMKKIAQYCIDHFSSHKVSVHHRVGKVDLTEKAVIIAVSSKHRKAAFEACEYVIDTLKKTVPIWKKEFLIDGSYWVNAHP